MSTLYASSQSRDQRELKVKSLITTVIQFLVATGQPTCASQFSVSTYRDRKLVSITSTIWAAIIHIDIMAYHVHALTSNGRVHVQRFDRLLYRSTTEQQQVNLNLLTQEIAAADDLWITLNGAAMKLPKTM